MKHESFCSNQRKWDSFGDGRISFCLLLFFGMCLVMCHDCQMQAYRDDRGNNILHLAAVHGATFVMRTPTLGCARVSDRVLTESKGCNSWNCFNKTMEHWKIICKRDGLEPSVTTTYLVGKCLHLNLNTCVEKAGGRQEITTMLLEEFGGCPKHSAKPETS